MASLTDLKLELWLRRRNSGIITWVTRDDKEIPIKDMTFNHLVNTINMIERNEEYNSLLEELACEYESENFGDR